MNGVTTVERSTPARSESGRRAATVDPSWAARVGEELARKRAADVEEPGLSSAADELTAAEGVPEDELDRLCRDAARAAHDDAEDGLPADGDAGPTSREDLLRERCRAAFERWNRGERRRVHELLTAREELVTRRLGRTELLLDRFERMINGVILLKAKRSTRRSQGTRPEEAPEQRRAGIPTRVYLLAIGFLGIVEFFANAPVFSTLLPRDPLTERQIGVIAETSTGWLAGAQRVMAQLVLRPDAALLAAGVVTFLLVLAHFFGHSLREMVIRKAPQGHRDEVPPRPILENAVPMLLTGIGLVLVLGVLFQARVILGDVGERRHSQDMEVVTELRREAGWLRTDGELLQASQLTDQADDLEAAALRLREYAASMSRMTFPILLLNLTLVLAAITAAYFHLRGRSAEEIDEEVFEQSRDNLAETAESTATAIADLLSRTLRPIREMQRLSADGYSVEPRRVAERLEAVLSIYRRTNPRASAARTSAPAPELRLVGDGDPAATESFRKAAAAAMRRHDELSQRFAAARDRLNGQLSSWEPGGRSGHARRVMSLIATGLLLATVAGCTGLVAEATDRDTPPDLALFVYDRSGSMPDYQLRLAAELTSRRVASLGHGDRIVAIELLEASLDEPPLHWSQAVPDREYPDLDVETDRVTRDRFLRDAIAYMGRFTDSSSRESTRGTDILSTLHDVAAYLRAHPGHNATLYLFSDMLQSNAVLDFEGSAAEPRLSWIDDAAASGQLPRLGGLCVVVVGARTDTDAGQAVKQFWVRYFDRAGATLQDNNYTLRPVELPAVPCAR